MLTTEMNYSNCPLKKRPFLMMDKEVKCEPKDSSVMSMEQSEPEDLSVNSKRRVISRAQTPESENRCSSVESNVDVDDIADEKPLPFKIADVKSERIVDIKHETPVKITESVYKNWPCPLTPPMHFAGTNEQLDPMYLPPGYPSRFDATFPYHTKDDPIFKTQAALPVYTSPYIVPTMDLRTNYNNNIIKADPFINPKYFTPYRVDQNNSISSSSQSNSSHRPLFNVFPLSPASSHASYNSYEESPRRSESPLSTNSSISEQPSTTISTSSSSTYSVFRDVTAMSTGAPVDKPKTKSEKPLKNAHYQCSDCSKSYSTYSGLSKHQQFHCPAVEGNQAKKVFSCKNCDKTYTSLGALKMHIRTHTLPCKCEICGKAFSRPWLLQGHIRTHTGEKPFSCQHCHRAFADRSNLRAHLQTHSEIKKYSCTTCSKTFSRMSLLTKHLEVGCPGIQMPHALSLYWSITHSITE